MFEPPTTRELYTRRKGMALHWAWEMVGPQANTNFFADTLWRLEGDTSVMILSPLYCDTIMKRKNKLFVCIYQSQL